MQNEVVANNNTHSKERSRIIRNTKIMEHNFMVKNLDLNKNYMDFCEDRDGNETKFIFSKTQENVMNRILAEVTRSVSESDFYDDTDTAIKRAKRIYSRKKEIIKIMTTVFDNGGHMVKYFKYITRSGTVTSSDITQKHVRNFIKRLRDSYNDAEVIVIDDERYLKPQDRFMNAMVKLDIYESDDTLRHDYQH